MYKEAKSIIGLRIKVLLVGNIAGYKWKPIVIWHSGSPRALKHTSEHTLPGN